MVYVVCALSSDTVCLCLCACCTGTMHISVTLCTTVLGSIALKSIWLINLITHLKGNLITYCAYYIILAIS